MKPVWFVTAVALLCAGCAAPPAKKIDAVYTGLQEMLPRFDPSLLAERVIIIDPGHGGSFTGTTGNDGLEEKAVNLGVALYLGGLLEEAGATVHFTRSADRDFLTENDSTLAIDLARRLAVIDSLQPDLFLSIHHNAQALRDPTKNAIETYYKFGDPASRDLAVAVHRHLMRNLGISDGVVKQGNYFVLRNMNVPAILGEASYLTHPGVEDQLKISEKQKLEAEAYYLGILDYFRRGTPRITLVSPLDSVLTAVPAVTVTARDIGGSGIDPDGMVLTVNDRLVHAVYDRSARMVRYQLPWDSPNGTYQISFYVRNIMGNASRRIAHSFLIDLPPTLALFETVPAGPESRGYPQRIRAILLDRRGLRIADGAPVQITTAGGGTTFQRSAAIRNGAAEWYLDPAAGAADTVAITLECRGKLFTHRLTLAGAGSHPSGPASRRIVTVDGGTGLPVNDVAVFAGDSLLSTVAVAGIIPLPQSIDGNTLSIFAPGYRPRFGLAEDDTILLEPWHGGVLQGKKFVLDPQGGGSKGAGVGSLGLSGAHVNLQVARYCESFLRQAGAQVLITRSSDETAIPQDIVAMTNRFGADRYIEIRHHHTSPANGPVDHAGLRTYCFPGSKTGNRFAGQMARTIGDYLGITDVENGSLVTYPLQQTACPAIVVAPPSIESAAEELLLGESWYLRLQAYALFLGILEHYTAPAGGELTVAVAGTGDRSNWLVTLDGTWNLLTPPDGRVRFRSVAAGSHRIAISRAGTHASQGIDINDRESKTLTLSPFGGSR